MYGASLDQSRVNGNGPYSLLAGAVSTARSPVSRFPRRPVSEPSDHLAGAGIRSRPHIQVALPLPLLTCCRGQHRLRCPDLTLVERRRTTFSATTRCSGSQGLFMITTVLAGTAMTVFTPHMRQRSPARTNTGSRAGSNSATLQRPLGDDALVIVARGAKKDEGGRCRLTLPTVI
jgi:hypothetical protein